MNRINRNNYESYLIDWMEGNLDVQTGEELMLFLDDNPDIKEELEEFENVFLEPESVEFSKKSILKKNRIIPADNINEDNFETFFIAWYENDLSLKEQNDVEQFVLANPFLKKEFELFGSLMVSLDEKVVYDNKELLYHRKKVIPLFWISSAAAVLLVLITVFGLLKYSSTQQALPNRSRTISQVSEPAKTESTPNAAVPQAENQNSSIVAQKTSAKAPALKPPGNNRKTAPVVLTTHRRTKTRPYTMLNEITSSNVNIKLTNDDVYCKFKYKRHLKDVSSSKPEKRKSLVGKVLAGLFKDAKTKANSMIPKNNDEPLLAKVFDGGAHVLNNYTGTGANVTKYYDNQGNLVAYHFSGGQINFNKKFNSQGR